MVTCTGVVWGSGCHDPWFRQVFQVTAGTAHLPAGGGVHTLAWPVVHEACSYRGKGYIAMRGGRRISREHVCSCLQLRSSVTHHIWCCAQMPVANVSYAGLALKAGINKDAARVGLNEILQKLGHYAGNLRDSARIQFFGLGTLVCSQGFARFRAGGNRGLGHSRSVQQIRPSSSSHIAPRAAVQAVRLARVVWCAWFLAHVSMFVPLPGSAVTSGQHCAACCGTAASSQCTWHRPGSGQRST